jgi:hypothetical protein
MRMPETSTEQTQVDFRNARLPTALMLQIVLTANFGTSPLLSSYLALIHRTLIHQALFMAAKQGRISNKYRRKNSLNASAQ